MKALTSHGKGDIRYESYTDPECHADTDVVVKMNNCGICGSDLHIYHGAQFTGDTGFCVGHEAMGEVAEVGRGVTRFKAGDQVMLSAAVGCGSCGPCLSGHINSCANNQMG